MHQRTDLNGTGFGGRSLAALVVAIAIGLAPSPGRATVFEVNTIDDGAGADGAGTRTFLWALNEVSLSTDSVSNSIIWVLDDFAEADDVVAEDRDFVIQIELITDGGFLTLETDVPLTIGIKPDPMATQYFFDIVRVLPDGSPAPFFIARDNLTLFNTDLRSAGIAGHRGIDQGTGEKIDLVYDIGEFVHDVRGQIKEFFVFHNRDDSLRLVKDGTGELALLSEVVNDDAYTGGTLLVDGVLRSDTHSLRGDVQICADGSADDGGFLSDACDEAILIFEMPSVILAGNETRTIEPPVNGTFAGNITSKGNGRVVKTGVGSLTLTGSNTYTGGTYIMLGEVIGDTDAIQGDVYICPGVDSLFKPNDPDGTGGGPSVPSLSCNFEQALLTFDTPTPSSAFVGTLNGQGIVQKTGSGTLSFNGTQRTFNGTLQISQGELAINSFLGGDTTPNTVAVTVNSGGTLSGTGTLTGDVTVEAGGVIRGSLNMQDDLQLRGTLDLTDQVMKSDTATLDDNSIVAITVGTSPGPGQLDVTNQLTLNAGSIDIAFDSGFVSGLSQGEVNHFTVATSQTAIVGTLAGGSSFASALFRLEVTHGDTDCSASQSVCITTTFMPLLIDDAQTQNQRNVATVLDRAFFCGRNPSDSICMIDDPLADDFDELFGNFSVPSSEIPDILDQLAGEEYSAFADVRSAGSARFNRSISRRFDLEFAASHGNDSEPTAGEVPTPEVGDVSAAGPRWKARESEAPVRRSFRDYRNSRKAWRSLGGATQEPMPIARHSGQGGFTSWLDVHGVMGELSGSKNADDIDYRIFGPLFGLDYGVTEHITVGVTMGYTRNQLDTPDSTSKGSGNTYQGGAYVGAVYDKFHVVGSARYAYSDLTTRRRIRFNTLDRTATADFDAHDTSVFVEAAYHLAPLENVIIQPMISIAYNHLYQGSFEESGANSLNLEIDTQEFDTVQSSFGVRIAMFGRDSDLRYLMPQFRLAYEREWLDKSRKMSANLPTAGTQGRYLVEGQALPRDRAVIGVSSEVGISDRVNLFVDYDLRAAPDLLEHSLAFGLRAIW